MVGKTGHLLLYLYSPKGICTWKYRCFVLDAYTEMSKVWLLPSCPCDPENVNDWGQDWLDEGRSQTMGVRSLKPGTNHKRPNKAVYIGNGFLLNLWIEKQVIIASGTQCNLEADLGHSSRKSILGTSGGIKACELCQTLILLVRIRAGCCQVKKHDHKRSQVLINTDLSWGM